MRSLKERMILTDNDRDIIYLLSMWNLIIGKLCNLCIVCLVDFYLNVIFQAPHFVTALVAE